MGAYLFGVSSKSRKVKGLGDVHEAKFITKARVSYFESGYSRVEEAKIANYKRGKAKSSYVAYDFVDGAPVYRLTRKVSVFSDYSDATVCIGHLEKVGSRFKFKIGA